MGGNRVRGRKRDFPGGPAVKNLPCNALDGMQVLSLVGELRFHKPRSN